MSKCLKNINTEMFNTTSEKCLFSAKFFNHKQTVIDYNTIFTMKKYFKIITHKEKLVKKG